MNKISLYHTSDHGIGFMMYCSYGNAYRFTQNDRHGLSTATRMLQTLSSPDYLAAKGTNGHFILKHSVGNLPSGSEIDVPLNYADYYFLEALNRYNRMKN